MNGNGIDRGLATGEQFGKFVYWAVIRHPAEKFTDESVERMIREEFPDRHLAMGGRGTIQGIGHYRSYSKRWPERMTIYSEAEAAELLLRIDVKMARQSVRT